MYSRPRCACLACSDLSQPVSGDRGGSLYRQPTTTIWRNDDEGGMYYNSNEVDVDQLRHGCGCFSGGQTRSTAVPLNAADRQRQPLLQGNPLTTCMSQPPLITPDCNNTACLHLSLRHKLYHTVQSLDIANFNFFNLTLPSITTRDMYIYIYASAIH